MRLPDFEQEFFERNFPVKNNEEDTPSRFPEFLFDMGKWYGSLRRPEIKKHFLDNGVTEDEFKAIEEAVKPLLKVIYRDR